MPRDPIHPPGPARRTIARTEIGGDEAELQERGGRHFVYGAGGSEQELTDAETEQVSRHADEFSVRAEERGLRLEDSPTQARSFLGEFREALPADRLAVLVDTTTIHNAREALLTRGRAPAPIALLDLSVLTAAATLFDTIVIQPERFPPLDDVRDLTQVLQPTYEVHLELERIYGEVWEAFNRRHERTVYGKKWAEFLDTTTRELPLDLDAVRTLDIEMTFGYSSTAEIADAFATPRGASGRENELAVALAIHTVRTGFNDAIAGMLGVPYLATSVRLPVSSDLADRKTRLLLILRQLIANSSPPGRAQPATFAPRTQIAAPMLLGLVLERMSKPEDYRAALDEVRERFAPLREQLREDRETAQWDRKPQLYMQRFAKHLGATDATFAGAQGAGLGAVQAGLKMTTALDPSFVTAALKIVAAVKPLQLAHHAYLRLWRPEIYVFMNLAKEARRLSLLDSRIKSIWGSELDPAQQRQLDRFASLRADPFLTPTSLM